LEQTRPIPTQSELNDLYENFYNFGGEKNTRYTSLRQQFFNSFVYRLWLKIDGDISFHLMRGVGKLLDVGCNEGRGLEFYKANGFEAQGLELNSHAANVARSKGFIVYGSTLEEFEQDQKFDVIVLSNVLEHSLDPSKMLSAIYRLLNPGGIVCISCPNSESWLRKSFGKYWINWHVPFHLTHFSQKTLTDLLAKNHFVVKKVENSTPALWVAHSIITRLFFVPGKVTAQLRSAPLVAGMILVIRGLFFPFLWLGNLLGRGDCLVLMARKP
jgi:2-polyprenyl-3-methyl-5-hydroxy-6-metoxy-1,4-benzoquinol methylase